MAVTICIIVRVIRFSCVSSANLSQVSTLSATWQSMQFRLKEEANIPIVSMNSSTGMPFRSWTFLKTSSAICGLGCWARANPPANRQIADMLMTTSLVLYAMMWVLSDGLATYITIPGPNGGMNERYCAFQRHALHAIYPSARESQGLQDDLGQFSERVLRS